MSDKRNSCPKDKVFLVNILAVGQGNHLVTSVWLTLAKVVKGAWRMPWLTEAMKDVISCDKPGVGANDL